MVTEFTSHKMSSTSGSILYFDFKDEQEDASKYVETHQSGAAITARPDVADTVTMSPPSAYNKSFTLDVARPDVNYAKMAAEFLESNVKSSEDGTCDTSKVSALSVARRVQMSIVKTCNIIAVKGRINLGNTIVANGVDIKKYELEELAERTETRLVENEYIPENTLYVIRNMPEDKINQPGFVYCYHVDDNDVLYHGIISIGFYPERQAGRIDIK